MSLMKVVLLDLLSLTFKRKYWRNECITSFGLSWYFSLELHFSHIYIYICLQVIRRNMMFGKVKLKLVLHLTNISPKGVLFLKLFLYRCLGDTWCYFSSTPLHETYVFPFHQRIHLIYYNINLSLILSDLKRMCLSSLVVYRFHCWQKRNAIMTMSRERVDGYPYSKILKFY